MLYNIVINQKAIFDNNLNVSANHIAILEVAALFIVSNKALKLTDSNGDWYWVSYDFIISQIPMFDIKKDRCRQLVKELSEQNLLELNPNNQNLGRVYMRVGDMYFKYKNFEEPLLKNSQPHCENTDPLAKKFTTPLLKNSQPPCEKIDDDNNINNTIYTNNNNTNNFIIDKKIVELSERNENDFELKNSEQTDVPKQSKPITNEKFEKEKSSAKKEKEPLLGIAIAAWKHFYKEKYDMTPSFSQIDGAKMKSIVLKMKKVAEEKQAVIDETNIDAYILKFLQLAYSDEWYRTHFSLSILDSKFNEILLKSTKNGTTGGLRKQNCYEEYAKRLARYSGYLQAIAGNNVINAT